MKSEIKILLTLSGVEWVDVGILKYIDIQLHRLSPGPINIPIEKIDEVWIANEEIIDPFAVCKNENEKTKKEEELRKLKEAEDFEIETAFKRSGNLLYIFGDFSSEYNYQIAFIQDGKGTPSKGYFRNKGKIGTVIPEIEGLELGIHTITIEVSINGQQFTRSGLSFNYLAFSSDMTPEQKNKYEDEEKKKLKKPGKK